MKGTVKCEMNTALNAICPYFTMFPLAFPFRILSQYARKGDAVLDPFAGRGTTLYAARLRGLPAFGIDSNPVAGAISEAKLANTSPRHIVASAKRLLASIRKPKLVPAGDFWQLAFHEEVLFVLCRLREGLMANCDSPARKALRAVILGALHGPLAKREYSYFSNQCPRTYAPKPRYAVKFWRDHKLVPPRVDVMRIIERRAERYFGDEVSLASGRVTLGDSQESATFSACGPKMSWIITSPPYYGLKTYIPDQWLRCWFIGGSSEVDYTNVGQLTHTSQECFSAGMRSVWGNCARIAKSGCRLIIRFGAINDRRVDALSLVKSSLGDTPWRVVTAHRAGTASGGKRQANHFVAATTAIEEYDVWSELRY